MEKPNVLLIVVDMQNDFIDGSLANPAAQAIVKPICEFINAYDLDVLFTRDTHEADYLETFEGKRLPVTHCIKGTEGWKVNSQIFNVVTQKALANKIAMLSVDKPTFGYRDWFDVRLNNYDAFAVVGTCTDICVVSNVLALKAAYPSKPITVYSNLCAGLTSEKHEAALEVMRSCQVDVEEWKPGK